ncbi:hypothetical protein L3Q82_001622 [Scortum barcoo]|uniref:Uncharacterized protein n=1 Tax=Scortum barcoo TaxID=214431 RepID=A0ACB8W5X0_9TELE|nr:hypothetical protein L3Q82_001622 [Scortum barcoo]
MDPADADTVRSALSSQGTKLQLHETQLNTIAAGVKQLTDRQAELQTAVAAQVNRLTAQLQLMVTRLDGLAPPTSATPASAQPSAPSAATSAPPRPVRLAPPEKFSGESGECRPFLVHCDLHFKNDPAAFSSEQARVAFMVSHLTGRAAAWATAEWARGAAVCQNVKDFSQTLSRMFDNTSPVREASRALFNLRQRNRRVMDYAIEFRTLAADSGWNEVAISDAFVSGLNEEIKDHLAPMELPGNFESLVDMATRIDNRLQERERERRQQIRRSSESQGALRGFREYRRSTPSSTPVPAPSVAPEELMQLGRAKLVPEERHRRLKEGVCFYCGKPGHRVSTCPVKEEAHQE